MTQQELIKVLDQLGLKPSRKLGQNFLVDQNIIDVIIREVVPQEGEHVLEIGPGTGVLTDRLLEGGVDLTAVEFDHRLAAYNRDRHASHPRFRLHEQDACKVDYQELMGDEPYRCIANLPYAISSIFISLMIETPNPPKQIYVMLQKEMADRLAAKPRTKAYGALSVRLQACYEVSLARKISKHVFLPPPDVDSALLDAKWREDATLVNDREFRLKMAEVTKTAFSQRRKQVRKVLSGKYGEALIMQFLEDRGHTATARAEELTVDDYINLTERVMA